MTIGENIVAENSSGGSAFPPTLIWTGMSLRDWFAGQALASFLSCQEAQSQLAHEVEARIPDERKAVTINKVLAKRSYMLADAMLSERDKRRES